MKLKIFNFKTSNNTPCGEILLETKNMHEVIKKFRNKTCLVVHAILLYLFRMIFEIKIKRLLK